MTGLRITPTAMPLTIPATTRDAAPSAKTTAAPRHPARFNTYEVTPS
ncbi:hypothetical protein GCM10009677_01050 [Sphaerisporangium rubeum]|uniref:Uncharacterized protein n=1 Tax=Sphaerisporangium rubeum TaxID=321317 RepID=A0A7X0IKF7_9ACTN|nr:hypothetical protein [Sphaerisporangium rubeum]